VRSQVVLVTGGAGYIGSHTCKALHRAGYRPVVVDNLVNGHADAVRWGPLEIADVTDVERMEQIVDRHRPSAVVHFAAFAYVGESVAEPEKYYQNNVGGALALLRVMRSRGVDKIIFSSTCATYGVPEVIPITEDQPARPINPYGASKRMVETILADYDAAYAIRHVALRYFNAAGADSEGDLGECHDPEPHLIPRVIETALGRRAFIEVNGTDYATPDGTAVRDYIHVEDLADAHVRALDHLLAGRLSVTLNVGTGCGYSVLEVIRAVERLAGATVAVRSGPRREGDPPTLIADASRATEVLGWRPRASDLDSIVTTALRWHRGSGFRS